LSPFPNGFDLIPVFLGDGFILVGEMHDPAPIHIFINGGFSSPATWRSFSQGGGRPRHNIQAQFGHKVFHCLLSLILSHSQLFSIGCRTYALYNLTDDIRGYRVIGDPPIFGFDADCAQHAFCLGLVFCLANL
jgi:hypothetical protein